MMMMGYAYQKGLLPLSAKAIEQAIEVNGVSIKMNTQAFQLGRLAAADPARLAAMMKGQDEVVAPKTLEAMSLDEIIAHRSAHLTDYQDGKLAERYRNLVMQVRNAATNGGYGEALPRAVAINYAKLLAYKDEYEVARLYTDGRSKSSCAISSRATSSSASTSRRRCSAAARMRSAGRRSARSAPG